MSIQRLQDHWGFTRMPFGRSLAPSMLHRHDGHAEAVARIGWCIDQHALGVITGEVGAGKTVAVRAATAALETSRHVVIYLPNPSVGVRGMLHHVVSALGQVPSFYTATLVPQAAAALAAEHAERGRTPVVIFDEAHLLDNAQLEAVRMLTNHDMDSGAPFAALLVGQPTLRHRLRLGVLAALDQRISVRYALGGMTATETADYISHDAASAVMRRGHLNGRAGKCISTGTSRIIQSCSRNARSLSGGRYRPGRASGGAVRAMAFSLSAM